MSSDEYQPDTQTSKLLWEHVQEFPKFPDRHDGRTLVEALGDFQGAYDDWLAELRELAERASKAVDRLSSYAARACDEGTVPEELRSLIAVECVRV